MSPVLYCGGARIVTVFGPRNCSTSCPLMSWYCTQIGRASVHSPSGPKAMSPSIVWNGCAVHVFGELVVVESLACLGDRLAQDLQFAIGEGRQEIAEQVDPFGRRPRLVFLDEIHDAGELHCRDRLPQIDIDDAVGRLAELHLDRCRLQSGKAAAEHLGVEPELADRTQDADRVGRIGRRRRRDPVAPPARRERSARSRPWSADTPGRRRCRSLSPWRARARFLPPCAGIRRRWRRSRPSSASGSAPPPDRTSPRRRSSPVRGRRAASRSISDSGTCRWRPSANRPKNSRLCEIATGIAGTTRLVP